MDSWFTETKCRLNLTALCMLESESQCFPYSTEMLTIADVILPELADVYGKIPTELPPNCDKDFEHFQ